MNSIELYLATTGTVLHVARAGEPSAGSLLDPWADRSILVDIDRQLGSDVLALARLQRCLEGWVGVGAAARAPRTKREVLAWLEQLWRTGRVRIRIGRARVKVTTAGLPPELLEPEGELRPFRPPPETHWVTIEIVGEDGKPAAGEQVRLVLPDNRVVETETNTLGRVHVDNIEEAGLCELQLPERDARSWQAKDPELAPQEPKDRLHWVALQLLGADDLPLAAEPCHITLPDGRLVKERTDESGMVTVSGLAQPGECTVEFPRLDAGAWEKM